MAEEAMERAIAHFDFVLSLEQELDDRFLLAIVYFWKGPLPAAARRVRRSSDLYRQGKRAGACLGHRACGGDAGARRVAFFSAGQMERSGADFAGGGARACRYRRSCDAGQHPVVLRRMARREGRFDKAIEFLKAPSGIMASGIRGT